MQNEKPSILITGEGAIGPAAGCYAQVFGQHNLPGGVFPAARSSRAEVRRQCKRGGRPFSARMEAA